MDRMLELFKSVIDQDTSAVVICDLQHTVVYMNPAACERYAKYGGSLLVGNNLLDCHDDSSRDRIQKVINWFKMSASNNIVHTFYNEQENKDVYMVALRNHSKALIGYYEKHEYRNRDTRPFYANI